MSRFLDALRERVVLGDGAMGTELLARGARSNNSLARLNLSDASLVFQIHREYVASGAELLRTNTFTANRLRMPPELVEAANSSGVLLAQGAGEFSRIIAGSVGPLHDLEADEDEKLFAYREQCEILADKGCDLILLETFGETSDLRLALMAADRTELPVVAHMTSAPTSLPGDVEAKNLVALGINCVPCDAALSNLRGIVTKKWIATFPSAGKPDACQSAEEFAEQAALLVDAGVRLIGGCCGTTPAHIRALARRLGR